MPEWSNGAVSKTVDRIHDPRVRIPLSPQKEKEVQVGSRFALLSFLLLLNFIRLTGTYRSKFLALLQHW